MTIYSIYRVSNSINKKVYIGFTSNFPVRILTHQKRLHLYNFKFYSAIKKHGWDNFVWEEIYQSTDREHTLNIMEPYFITEYNSYCGGYNSTLGGEGGNGRIIQDKTRLLLSRTLEEKMGIEKATALRNELSRNHPCKKLGWVSKISGENHFTKQPGYISKVGADSSNYNSTLYLFRHKITGISVHCTSHHLIKTYGLETCTGTISSLLRGNRRSVKGWQLVSE